MVNDKRGYVTAIRPARCSSSTDSLRTKEMEDISEASVEKVIYWIQQEQLLLKVIKNNDIDAMKTIIRLASVDILLDALRKPSRCSDLPLHRAMWEDRVEMVELILDRLSDEEVHNELTRPEKFGNTPLHLAARNNSVQSLSATLKRLDYVAALCVEDAYGRIPIHQAAMYNSVDCMKCMLSELSPNQRMACLMAGDKQNRCAFNWAASNGHHDVMDVMLSYLPRESIYKYLLSTDRHQTTPVHKAAGTPNIDTLAYMIQTLSREQVMECLSAVDHYGRTPLHWACWENRLSSVKFILDRVPPDELDFYLTTVSNFNMSGLMECTRHLDGRIFQFISSNLEDGDWGELMKHQISDNVPEHWADEVGFTPLHRAVRYGATAAIKYLLQRSDEIGFIDELLSIEDNQGRTVCDLDMTKEVNLILSPYVDHYIMPREGFEKTQMLSFIAYNTFEESRTHPARSCAEQEAQTIEHAWKTLGFQTIVMKNWTFEELMKAMEVEIQSRCNSLVLLIVTVMSHGEEGAIIGTDGGVGFIREIVLRMNLNLENVPKVLFTQCCQGSLKRNFEHLSVSSFQPLMNLHEKLDPSMRQARGWAQEVEMTGHMCIINATKYGGVAMSQFFIPALSEQLLSKMERRSIDEIYRLTCKRMEESVKAEDRDRVQEIKRAPLDLREYLQAELERWRGADKLVMLAQTPEFRTTCRSKALILPIPNSQMSDNF